MTVGQLLLVIIGHAGERGFSGRTRMQKVVFFLSRQLRVSVPYSPYYYGPYSEQVAASLDSLVARGLVEEKVRPFPSQGPFEGKEYTYTLTDDGKAVLEAIRQRHPDEYERADRQISKLLQDDPSTRALAVASKVLTAAKRSKQPVGRRELREHAASLGWAVSEDDVRDGVDLLVKHGFVRLRRS